MCFNNCYQLLKVMLYVSETGVVAHVLTGSHESLFITFSRESFVFVMNFPAVFCQNFPLLLLRKMKKIFSPSSRKKGDGRDGFLAKKFFPLSSFPSVFSRFFYLQNEGFKARTNIFQFSFSDVPSLVYNFHSDCQTCLLRGVHCLKLKILPRN